jgi:flagellar L-ring protein precursor FlgH
MMARVASITTTVCLLLAPCSARGRKPKTGTLNEYLSRVQLSSSTRVNTPAAGSLWISSGPFSDISADNKARRIGDLVIVRISEQFVAQSSSSVASQRKLQADSGISALGGKINTAGVDSLFSPHSNQVLQGQGQTSSKSLLQTSLTGRVVAILPGDSLVIEAERSVSVNNERQNVVLRGVAKAEDVSQENAILSTQLSNLEVEVAGKGIVSDSTRPPVFLVRWLFKILGF